MPFVSAFYSMPAHIPEKIIKLAQLVRHSGGRALLVGGCVRDGLMNEAPKDWDVEVYGIEPAALRQLLETFGRVDTVGEAFTVYKLGSDLDVSIPRRERKQGRGHRAFVIEGDPLMSFEDALRRRDFTINAILQDPLTNELIDPFNGQADIRNKTLRAVAIETFAEDSLRVLRAAQFAARFEFDIEPATVELCRAIDLTDLPRERIWNEMEKLLLRARRPSIGLKWLDELGVTAQLFPELQALIGVPQESEWHPEGWVLTAMASESLVASVTQAFSVNKSLFSLREFLAASAASPTVSPASDRAFNTQPGEASFSDFPPANGTRAHDSLQPSVAAPAIDAQAESFVWTFGALTPRANEVVRVVSQISLNRMRSIVRSAVNDFEVVRGVVQPIAVFVVNVLSGGEWAAKHQFHNDPVNAGRAVFTLPTGVHITVVIVDARTAIVDDNVLLYFDLPLKTDANFVHSHDAQPSSISFHVEIGDVGYHTKLVVDRARELIADLPYAKQVTVMLAALCHDFGKPATTEFIDGRIRSRGHEEAGVQPTESFLERLNVHTINNYDVHGQVVALVRDHLKPGEFYRKREEVGDGAFRRLARRCELDLLYRVARADSLGRNADWVPREKWYGAEAQEWFIHRARELEVEQRAPAEILMGRHLQEMGLKPSPLFGKILKAVYEMQLDGRVSTLEDAKESAQKMLEASNEN